MFMTVVDGMGKCHHTGTADVHGYLLTNKPYLRWCFKFTRSMLPVMTVILLRIVWQMAK